MTSKVAERDTERTQMTERSHCTVVSPVLNLSRREQIDIFAVARLPAVCPHHPPFLITFSNVKETNLTQDDKTDK